MKKLEMTPVYARYFIKFIIRIIIFTVVLAAYLWDKNALSEMMTKPIWEGMNAIHILWSVFMIMMLLHMIPGNFYSMAILKQKPEKYEKVEGYSELKLLKYVQNMNIRAWIVMLVWLSANACFGLLYLMGIWKEEELLMLTVFYFLCDYICILLFCPFQTFIMKNKCCVNCRIYDWGHVMMFMPMLMIRNFFSWSLFFMSILVMFRWEMIYALHPERYWEGSNKKLQCANCRDKTCQLKKRITEKITKI